jgi:hypothetical protein
MTENYYEDDEVDEDWDEDDLGVLGPDGPRLLAMQCATCIFRPHNVAGLRPGRLRQLVRDVLAGGGFIPCHETIRRATMQPAICRGFYDKHGPNSNLIRVWGRIGNGFAEVPAPPDPRRQPPQLQGGRGMSADRVIVDEVSGADDAPGVGG